jgi:hypothetical protein
MRRTRTTLLTAALLLVSAPGQSGIAQRFPTAPEIPPDAVAVMEFANPAAFLDLVLAPEILDSIAAMESYREFINRPEGKRLEGVVRLLEGRLETGWRPALGKLVAGGVTLALGPGKAAVLVVEAEESAILEKLHAAVLDLVRIGGALEGAPDRVRSREHGGVTLWIFRNGSAYAISGNRLIVANRPAVLEAALDRLAGSGEESRALTPVLAAARDAAGADADGRILLDFARLKHLPVVARALTQKRNPLATFFFAGVTNGLRDARWLALGLRVRDQTLGIDATVDARAGGPADPSAFAVPSVQQTGVLPNLRVPGRIAAFTVYRDLYRFYAAKDLLFPERTSELIFFENMMGIFFSGRDLTEEVLSETKPGVRFVVAEPVYDPAIGTPRVKIPAFAAVLRLRNPETFRVVAEEAWQKALGLINFTRGQKGQPGLIIDRLTHGETKFTVAAFSAAGIENRTELDDRFNFRPSIAVEGDSLILSSSDGLARDLIDALRAEAGDATAPRSRVDSLVEIDGARVAAALAANRETLVRQNMVGETGGVCHRRPHRGGASLEAYHDPARYEGGSPLRASGHPVQPAPEEEAVTAAGLDPARAWEPYEPDADRPWNLGRAGHLLRRAGFGATWDELRQALRHGPRPTIDRLLKPAGDVVAFDRTHDRYEAAVGPQDTASLRAWWLRRMLTTPHPLQEKMTLFWHGHFAVSNGRVGDARLMRALVGKLRTHALGSFRTLLDAVVGDPAVALGLGAKIGRKARPNEEFARVLLAEFTLGPDACTERDVRESARAFTGWSVLRGRRRYFAREHDGGRKRILGRDGAWTAADAVRILLEHPATSRHIVRRLFRWLIAETASPVDETLIAPLAVSFARDHDIGKLVQRILRSNLFFSAAAYRQRVKGPVEFALGLARAAEAMVPTVPLGADLAALGQDLYHPPTVQGWTGGRHWINGATWVRRSNLALALAAGSGPYGEKLDLAALAARHGHAAPADAGRFLVDLYLQGDVAPPTRAFLLRGLDRSRVDPKTAVRRCAHALATLPEFHLA